MKSKKYGVVKRNIKIHLTILVFTLAGIGAIYGSMIWDEMAYAFTSPTVTAPERLPIKDYVMNEAEKAGIDKWRVYDLIQCESRWNPEAKYINKGGANGIDRGLWQISDKHHPEISNSCAYSVECSTREALKIIKKYGFNQWMCNKKI